MSEKYATVTEVIEILKELENNGFGDYEVICGFEYGFAKKGDKADINEKKKFINLGGYC